MYLDKLTKLFEKKTLEKMKHFKLFKNISQKKQISKRFKVLKF